MVKIDLCWAAIMDGICVLMMADYLRVSPAALEVTIFENIGYKFNFDYR